MIFNFPSGKMSISPGQKLAGVSKDRLRPYSCELVYEDVQYLIDNPDYLNTIKTCLSYNVMPPNWNGEQHLN